MKLLAEEKEIVDKPGAEELKNANGDIELDHVSHCLDLEGSIPCADGVCQQVNFSYDERMTALKDLTVKIPAGTSVALVG